jgi:hypothetical protein
MEQLREVMSMKRVKVLVRVAVACGLVLPVLLVGCTQHKAASAAVVQPSIEAAADSVPEVVITARREGGQKVVLSDSSTQAEAVR